MESLTILWQGTGIAQLSPEQAIMIVIGLGLLYLAISHKFEPLLLVPIGFGGILANIPGVDIAVGEGVLAQFYNMGIGDFFVNRHVAGKCVGTIFGNNIFRPIKMGSY